MIPRPPRSTLFPSPTLFRSPAQAHLCHAAVRPGGLHALEGLERRQLSARGLGHSLPVGDGADRKSTRLNSSHGYISYAVFCLKKKKTYAHPSTIWFLCDLSS